MEFKGKVVLITGSSRGIGKAIALMFAKEGAFVVINYNKSKDEADKVLNQIKKISNGNAIQCDVSKEIKVQKMINKIINRYHKIDILVNNAGCYISGDEWNGSSNVWEKTIKQNLISVMNTSKYVAEVFEKQRAGIIINIASRFAVSGSFDSLAYGASKAGIVNVTQAYAKLLSPYGRVNSISPGPVKSGYWLSAPKKELAETICKMPRKKLIEPEEVAKLVLSLCSEESKITGQNILIT